LAYVDVDSTDLADWVSFGGGVLGMQVIASEDRVHLKMDSRPWRIRATPSDRDGLRGLGWLAQDAASFETLREQATASRGPVVELDEAACVERSVERGFSFADDLGFRHEVTFGMTAGEPFQFTGTTTGFVTGEMGMGHVVFYVSDLARADSLFIDLFGMSLREDIPTQVGGGGHFYSCNPRHHTVAVVDSGHPPGVMHVMVEMAEIDDVGTALDRAREEGWESRTPLGRHRTDHMLSFYVPGPGGFDFEVGCGGLNVDDETWATAKETMRKRAWGHTGLNDPKTSPAKASAVRR
jgi:2,3-dihydroxybiphenyl 1,2-dioxygenase